MSRSSLIIGLVLAAVMHAALFAPALWTDAAPTTQPPAEEPPAVAVTPPPEPQPAPKPEPVSKPEPTRPEKRQPQPEPIESEPTPPLQEVHEQPETVDPPPQKGDTHAKPLEDADPSELPPLRIVWDSPGALRQIAGRLGMRIVAVNAKGEILGEVPSDGGVRLVEFKGRLDAYSNRVRTLPVSFFGSELARQSGGARRLWVLVPVGVDQRWVHAQKQAIAKAGVELAGVRELEGEFRRQRGSVRLVVTRIRHSVN